MASKVRALAATALLHFASLASVALAQTPQTRGTGPGDLQLSPCTLPGLTAPAHCGALDVSENPDRPQGRRLSIGVAVVPAASMQALPDPIVVLMGGPGEDAISAAALFAHRFSSLLQHRDLLLVDQRGTGRSGALRCELYSVEDPAPNLRDLFPSEAAARCARQLSKRADLTQYSYTHFASDLEHIRRALAYGPMNLFAGSYGTRAAQVYVRSYPASVRTVYFGSVVPIDVPTPLTFAKTTDHAIETLFDACSAAPSCRDAFPKLRGEFDAIVAQLDKGVRVQVPARTGEAPLHRGRVIEWFRSRLYRPASATRLPLMIHRAYLGDWRPIVEGILDNAAELNAELSVGLLFAITCSEDVAAIREEDIARETAKTALGDYRVRQQQTACSHWPKTSLPRSYRAPVHSSVPALFVSGDMDGASPLWFTERVAPGFSHRLEVVLAGKGHTEWSDCLAELYGRFVRSGATDGLESSSCEPAVRPPFETQ